VPHRPGVARGHRLGDDEIPVEFDVVEHGPAHEVGDAPAHIGFGIHDVLDPELLEDEPVLLADGLRPDRPGAHALEQRCREDAGLDVGPDPDDDPVEVDDTELLERRLTGGVGAHDVGEHAVERLHRVFVGVDSEHLGAGAGELRGEGAAEAAQPDDRDGRGGVVARPATAEEGGRVIQ